MKQLLHVFLLGVLFSIGLVLGASPILVEAQSLDDDLIFSDRFEGEPPIRGTISGYVRTDPNNDGDLVDGQTIESATVYLDDNFNARLDDGERTVLSDATGFYRFEDVPGGTRHVRQILPPANTQTFPGRGVTPDFDRLPDEVFDYQHAAPGVGQFDEPYGENASDWPAGWSNIEIGGGNAEPVSPDLLLKPIGVRGEVPAIGTFEGSEFLSLPAQARVVLRFDEPIVDAPGPDMLLHAVNADGGEQVEVRVGSQADDLRRLGFYDQAEVINPLELSDRSISGPIHYVEIISQNNGGGWPGFDLVGVGALNIAIPDPGAHVVHITADDLVFADRDFGRHFRDLAPELVLVAEDADPATPELRAGESAIIRVSASDDVGVSALTLTVNGQPVVLDADDSATMMLQSPGELVLQASATDTAGQVSTRRARYQVNNSDGSIALPPGLAGPGTADGSNAPRLIIIAPEIGSNQSADVEVIGSIESDQDMSWALDYAPVELIDPFDLQANDPDYLPIASGSGQRFSELLGVLPLSALSDGVYFLRLSATTTGGVTAWYGHVFAKNVAESDLRPQVSIESPVTGERLGMVIPIVAAIESARAVTEWRVEYALAEQVDLNNLAAAGPDWKPIADGVGELAPGSILGEWQTSMTADDSYVIRVLARNAIGLGRVEGVLVEVAGAAKLGRNRLEFDDINIDFEGMPLSFVRVYDSLDAQRPGDLGFGWTLKMRDADIRETVPDTGVLGLFGSTPLRSGTRIYLNAPDGQRLGFTFEPQAGTPSGLGTPYRASFKPDPGNYWKLEVPEGDQEFLSLREDGNVYLFFVALPYNPTRYVLIEPNGTRYLHDENEGLLEVRDRQGNSITYTPDGVAHSNGARLQFVRDPLGRIAEVIGPGGNIWTYGYDAQGDLVSFTDPDGRTSSYTYLDKPAHFLASIIDPEGRTPKRHEYDPDSGRLVAIIDENGNRQEASYDLAAFSGTTRDARGNVTLTQYDERGNIVRIEDPQGNVVQFEYSDPDNPDRYTRQIDANGEVWDYSYNSLGQATELVTPLESFGNQIVHAEYDDFGNMTRHEDSNSRTSTYSYDAAGNRTSEAPYAGLAWEFSYGGRGQQTQRRMSGSQFQVDYQFDDNGFLTGHSDTTGYALNLSYDSNGRLISQTDANRSLDVSFSAGGLLQQQIDEQGNTMGLVRNPDGSLNRTDRNGVTSRLAMDAQQRPIGLDLPNGGGVGLSYDPDGNPASITDPLGQQTSFVHDSLDRLVQITDASGAISTMQYDPVGNLIEIVDRNNRRRSFEYDENRRMTVERWFDASDAVVRDIVFTYQGNRGLVQVDDSFGGQTYTYRYGGTLPRPSVEEFFWPGQSTVRLSYGWSSETTFPVLVGMGFGFLEETRVVVADYAGLSYGLNWTHPGDSGAGNFVTLIRDPDGVVKRIERVTGFGGAAAQSITRYGHDSRRWVEQIRHEDDAGQLLAPVSQLNYQRDPEGRITQELHADNQTDYQFDDEGQLLAATHSNPSYPDESYSYDLGGNRADSHLSGGMLTLDMGNRVTQDGDLDVDYDAAGNVIRRSDAATATVMEFDYDHRNRLIQARRFVGAGATPTDIHEFEYDYLDRMIYRIINGQKTWIVHDRDQVIAEFADGQNTLSAAFLYDPSATDQVHAVWRDDAIGERWFLHDQLGSVRGITDSEFNLLSWVDYQGFGALQPGALPAGEEPVRFAARPYNDTMELYDNRRRFLDPRLGRFTQEDPISFAGRDFNLYRYALNHPLGITDPSGEIAAINQADLLVFALGLGALNPQNPDDLTFPCHIAHWSATNFAYFDPLADLILNPPLDGKAPTIERDSDYSMTGCNAR